MKETPSHTQRLLESLDDQTGGVRLHIHFRLAVPEFQGVALMPWQQRSSDSNSLSMWDFELILLELHSFFSLHKIKKCTNCS